VLLVPALIGALAMAFLFTGRELAAIVATAAAAAAAGYCVWALTTWVAYLQIFSCGPHVLAELRAAHVFIGTQAPMCSWVPVGWFAGALVAVLASAVAILIVALNRGRDWRAWGMSSVVYVALGFLAVRSFPRNPADVVERSSSTALIVAVIAATAISMAIALLMRWFVPTRALVPTRRRPAPSSRA
jgi:hypothetical protein